MRSDNSTSRLAAVRQYLLDAVGPAGLHAVEDGLTVGIIAGLAVTVPVLAGVVLAAVTGHPRRSGPLAIIRGVGDVIRHEDARRQESYFAVGVVVGATVGLGVGTALGVVGAGEILAAAV